MPDFRIHGDNIVECDRTLDQITRALRIPSIPPLLPTGSPLAPTYSFSVPGLKVPFRFTFFPGYGRWDINILDIVRQRGGRLREAADAIISRVVDGKEVLLLAIEYCGALPAGNQAWQRNGRALSFAHASFPYMYITELSGYELDAEREHKAARMPNPAVPFSYLLLTESTKSPAIPVFIRSPGASEDAIHANTPFFGEVEFLDILRRVLLEESTEAPRKGLEEKVLGLVKFLAGNRRKGDSLTPEQWVEAFKDVLNGGSLPRFLVAEAPIAWSKTAYIAGLTGTARELMVMTARFARGLTSASLPMCIVAAKDRRLYADAIADLYPAAPKSFLDWCRQDGHLAVCWVMGFKPRGDDARPDRGLPPFCRMLAGDKTDMLTVVYGPAPAATWPLLKKNPASLMERNGLWESVLVCSDALLVDTSTLSVRPPLTYLKSHWAAAIHQSPPAPFAVTPAPTRVGENDVDTVLHLLFARLGHRHVFEGMCNPPGGDWSGLSILTADRTVELRWLVLPRVTAKGAKRPDHVFQVFDYFAPSLILAIESKEQPQSVEPEIGPRLLKYIDDLLQTKPSVQRTTTSPWRQYDLSSEMRRSRMASAAAFVATDLGELATVAARAHVDLVMGFAFPSQHSSCTLLIHCCTEIGVEVANFLKWLPLKSPKLAIEIQS